MIFFFTWILVNSFNLFFLIKDFSFLINYELIFLSFIIEEKPINYINTVILLFFDSKKSNDGINWVTTIYYLTPLVSVTVTVILAMYNVHINHKNLILQYHKDDLLNSYKDIYELIILGVKSDIEEYLGSINSIYLSKKLHQQISNAIKDQTNLSDESIEELCDLIKKEIFDKYY